MLHVTKIALSFGEVAAAHKVSKSMGARLAAIRAQDLGPTFVKMGQFASTRADILSSEYYQEFSGLRDDVRKDPEDVVEQTVLRRLGIDELSEVFSEFDLAPVASASVAQVHKAVLRATGKRVAVKVMKDGVESSVENDIRSAQTLAGVIKHAQPALHAQVTSLVNRYSAVLRREIDFAAEAAAAGLARKALRRSMGGDVIVPKPIMWKDGIIVMDYVPSVPISKSANLSKSTGLVIEAIFSLIAAGECFHQDPHEGNMGIARVNGEEKLVLYDFGNVSCLSKESMDGIMEAGMAFQMRDTGRVAKLLVRHKLIVSGAKEDAYMPVLTELVNQAFDYVDTMNIGAFDPGKLDRDSAHLVQLSDEVNAVLRSITMAEGVCKSAYPGFDLQSCIDEYLAVHGADIAARRATRDLSTVLDWLL